jgi:hypothetical protein
MRDNPKTKITTKEVMIMIMCYYDYDIATQEMADYAADMMELAGEGFLMDEEMADFEADMAEMAGEADYPTDEKMVEMAIAYGEA